jgi:hypothetical protein
MYRVYRRSFMSLPIVKNLHTRSFAAGNWLATGFGDCGQPLGPQLARAFFARTVRRSERYLHSSIFTAHEFGWGIWRCCCFYSDGNFFAMSAARNRMSVLTLLR